MVAEDRLQDGRAGAGEEGVPPAVPRVQQYGLCLKATLPEVEKGLCEREFQQLRACWLKAFRAALRSK
ncbi:hypothetical protein CHLNCDRAFT_141329 [Chlorella variabilis]|uniref:CHCH domain-containing protein n=1 Tax=Chlorella variabilis TaxID=554065 RepID=E1ZSM8_CHLVA|nr:hypothetical protein CHLNCDRAFT_141329 [Chlorella variabilis]EFN51131.1 hypothetical protein CHLNCDRAFT_141329 [Chlorella variabilis]|eukprot:XP_005843233.1 hypothetical protein CHLNCDRAFT_141329 [Chlorella variabilis]